MGMLKLDEVDCRILAILQENARAKLSLISKQVHLSVTAVVNRIERMEDSGVIRGYRVLLDGEKAGMEVHGFLIGGVSHRSLAEVSRYLDTVPEIIRCETIISGGKELLLEFYFEDLDGLMKFYDSKIKEYLDSMTVYLVKGAPRKDCGLPLER